MLLICSCRLLLGVLCHLHSAFPCCVTMLQPMLTRHCFVPLSCTAVVYCCSVLQRTALSDDDIRSEVEALERQGHRRLLVLTGEHPKYTFDQFLHVSSPLAGCMLPANAKHASAEQLLDLWHALSGVWQFACEGLWHRQSSGHAVCVGQAGNGQAEA